MTKKSFNLLLAGLVILVIVLSVFIVSSAFQSPVDGPKDVPVEVSDEANLEDEAVEKSEQPSLAEQLSFETVLDNDRRDDAPLWIFPVPEDDGRIVLSMEKDSGIFVGVLDVDHPTAPIDWQQVISSQDIDGQRVADHWHIFAHDAHWIVFSVNTADQGYLLKLDKNFQRLGLTPIEHEDPTNDMFLVESDEGVDAGFFLVGYGNRIFRFDQNLNLLGTKDIGGGTIVHGSGSSALLFDGTYYLFASQTLQPNASSWIKLFLFDTDWNYLSGRTLVDEDEVNAAMGSAVILEDGSFILVARLIPDAYPRGVRAPKAIIGETPDSGRLIRFVFDSDGSLLSQETILDEAEAYRPHVSLVGDLLFTGWDAIGGYLRIDRLIFE